MHVFKPSGYKLSALFLSAGLWNKVSADRHNGCILRRMFEASAKKECAKIKNKKIDFYS